MTASLLATLKGPHPALSFEFFPPKSAAGSIRLAEHAATLANLAPSFLSVTYGAGGGLAQRREDSIATTRLLSQVTASPTVAHLALSGHTTSELGQVIDQFLAAEVAGFMALRGDPPDGPGSRWIKYPRGLTYANELVALIRQRSALPIGVAAFPFGHPGAGSLAKDTAVLRAKVAAGAEFAITQVLFEAQPYRQLLDRVAAAGLDLPVVPGIMPITPRAKVAKLELFHGAPLPAELCRRLAATDGNPEARGRVGLEWATHLVSELLAEGAPGVHFYTLNSSVATARICAEAGLTGQARPI